MKFEKEQYLRLIYWMVMNSKQNLYNFENKIITPKEWFLKRKKSPEMLREIIKQGYLREIEDIKAGPNVYQVTQKFTNEVYEIFGYPKWQFQELDYSIATRHKKEKAKTRMRKPREEITKVCGEFVEKVFTNDQKQEVHEYAKDIQDELIQEKTELVDFFNKLDL